MFEKARVKLTLWYLLIIMSISLSFSLVIYKGVSLEFQRRLNSIERRVRRDQITFRLEPDIPLEVFLEDLEQAKKRVLILLVYANGAILLFSSVAGYFLAGKTLKPIEETLEEQKRFVADASHELRTPLTSLITSIEVGLRDKKLLLNEAKSILKSNLEDIKNMQNLTDNLLSLARIQANNQKLEHEDIDLSDVVSIVIKKFRLLIKANKQKISLDLKNAPVYARNEDIFKLVQIFIDNSIKYTPIKGEINIKTGKERNFVYLEISDTGIGIEKTDLPHIFDRFYRADKSRAKNQISGFGLGLSLAKKIVDNYGGEIKVKSILNQGTTFKIILPAKSS
jgi:signal transduction histidine kinase